MLIEGQPVWFNKTICRFTSLKHIGAAAARYYLAKQRLSNEGQDKEKVIRLQQLNCLVIFSGYDH